MKYLFIINHQPYGNDLPFNGLRLAMTLEKEHHATVDIFLMGDAVTAAIRNQKTLNGSYNIERMLKVLASRGSRILVCGSCMEYRGITDDMLMDHSVRSSMSELAKLSVESDHTLSF